MMQTFRNMIRAPIRDALTPISSFSSPVSTDSSSSSDTKPPKEAIPEQIKAEKIEKDKLYSRLELELRGIDPAVMKSYSWFVTSAAYNLGIEVGKCWAARKAHPDRMTLLKSVHIFKKHRVQYEIRTHFRYMNFHRLTGSTLDTFLEYIERNLPEGVAMHAVKAEIQEIPEHLREYPATD